MEVCAIQHDAASYSYAPPHQANQSKRAQKYTKEEWEAQRDTIVGMYPLKGMTLKSIADVLYQERRFSATYVAISLQ
jgi:hypothetical protein